MKKTIQIIAIIITAALLYSCTKQYNCKCNTAGHTTDFFEKVKEKKASDWCDTIEVRMNNGNNPQKDSTYCGIFGKK